MALQKLPYIDFALVEPMLSWRAVSSVEGESRMDITTDPSLTFGVAPIDGASSSVGGPVVSEPFTVAYPVEFLTHSAGLLQIASAAYFQSAV